jgi:hypothetical protein
MPVLTNPRHERFAHFVAQGKTQYEAYELCGYKPSNGNPCKLASNPAVAQRIKEILEKTAAAAEITSESLVKMHRNLHDHAVERGQISAGVAAVKEMSILTGHRVERAEIGSPGEYEALSDEELERQLMERLAELGFTSVAALVDFSPSEPDAECEPSAE